ncbi:metal-dependent hydrolase [Halovenus halobia]|uniref:metal-dependent hydrolase n=1 Tax=Halovenus halobia TaxID=3396622 RepID=UPI003F573609
MYRPGHTGAALLAVTPLAIAVGLVGTVRLSVLAFLVAAAVASLPDIDNSLPVEHRGPTHTVWFVAALAAVAGVVGWLVASGPSAVIVGLVVGVAVGLSLTSHLVADSITPMGIRPFLPVSDREFCFNITPAKNPRANSVLLTVGLGIASSSQILVSVLASS